MRIDIAFTITMDVDALDAERATDWLHARLASYVSGQIPFPVMQIHGIESMALTRFKDRVVKEAA